MLLLLVRHAITALTGKKLLGWTPGVGLSDEGIAQANNVAEQLETLPIKAVYSSPIDRCVETSELIANRHGLVVKTDERFGEVRYGDWQGKTFNVLYKSKSWKDLIAHPADFRFPNGETIRETQTRAVSGIEDLRRRHDKQAVVVCSHADLVRIIVAAYIGLPLDFYSRMVVEPATVTAVFFGSQTPRLLKLNDSGSNSDLLKRLESMKQRPAKAKKK